MNIYFELINCKATSGQRYLCMWFGLFGFSLRNLLREEFVGKKLHKTAYSPANTYLPILLKTFELNPKIL